MEGGVEARDLGHVGESACERLDKRDLGGEVFGVERADASELGQHLARDLR
jgi:hypothetical protein